MTTVLTKIYKLNANHVYIKTKFYSDKFSIVWSDLYGGWNTCLRIYPMFTFWTFLMDPFTTDIYFFIYFHIFILNRWCFFTSIPHQSCHITSHSLNLKLNVFTCDSFCAMKCEQERLGSLLDWHFEKTACASPRCFTYWGWSRVAPPAAFKQHVAEPEKASLRCVTAAQLIN